MRDISLYPAETFACAMVVLILLNRVNLKRSSPEAQDPHLAALCWYQVPLYACNLLLPC